MQVPLSSTAARGALAGLALLSALYLTYFSVRTARATYYTEKNTLQGYQRATQIEPENARNWYLLGRYSQYSLEDQNGQRAIESYVQSLKIDPVATMTWLDLAAEYESEGNDAAARKAYLSAQKVYPLSADVSWRYGNFLLRQGELDAAFAEIRSSVMADPNRATEAFSRTMRVEPDADVILDKVLPANPSLYLAVMQDLASEQQTDNALKVWKRIVPMHPKIALPDVFVFVELLRQYGRIPQAHEVWEQAASLAGLDQLDGPKNSVIWDGGFESDVTGRGYAWRIVNGVRAAQISFDTEEKHSGKRSLRVSFDGSADVWFHDVCQVVPVNGGTAYRLSGWMLTKDLSTDEGLRLDLSGPGVHVKSESVHGTQPWTLIEKTWEGAAANTEVTVCLAREPSAQEDNKIRGMVNVDEMALIPMATSGAKP